ncbi:hypothetical protein Tco_0985081 [Tanacetum coccineum]
MLLREILLDVVGTSGYRCEVLRSFLVEKIEQGNERILSPFLPSRSSESTSFKKTLRCWFGSSDRSPWNEHRFAPTNGIGNEEVPRCFHSDLNEVFTYLRARLE